MSRGSTNGSAAGAARRVDSGPDHTDRVLAARALAGLRLLLLPIVFAADHLGGDPTAGTLYFDLVFGVACVYGALLLIDSWQPGGPRAPTGVVVVCDVILVSVLAYESGGAFAELRAAFLALPLGAALLLAPGRTAVVSAATGITYIIVAFTHPATSAPRLELVLTRAMYVMWIGIAAVVLATLLTRRRDRILEMAATRGRLVAQALAAEERERQRLSEALHDHAIQNLLTARQDIAEARAGDPGALARAEHALRLTLAQLRGAALELHPYLLDQDDLQAALETIAEQQARRGGYEVKIDVDQSTSGLHDQLLGSLVRELLTNAAKHANANHVTVKLARQDQTVILDVTDDGKGFTSEQHAAALRAGHIGLASSRERVEANAGTFQINSRPGGGTRVRCTLPAPPHESPPPDRNATVLPIKTAAQP